MLHKRRTLTPEEAFPAEIEAAIRRAAGIRSVRRGEPLQLTVTLPSGRPKTVILHNLFAETRQVSSAERARRIEQFVRASTLDQQVPEDWATASSQLMPSVRAVA